VDETLSPGCSLAAALPQGVVIDVDVCLGAPRLFWLSGVGDLVSKLSAVADWKLAFHNRAEIVDGLFHATDFWEAVQADPFCREEWLEAVAKAPGIKDDFFTVLSLRDCLPEVRELLDGPLRRCFV
jgi:hypothetical protein